MQGYIENEVNFNREGSCARSCDDYQKARQHNCRNGTACQFNYLDRRKTRCEGAIRNCTFIESDMSLCTNVRRVSVAVDRELFLDAENCFFDCRKTMPS